MVGVRTMWRALLAALWLTTADCLSLAGPDARQRSARPPRSSAKPKPARASKPKAPMAVLVCAGCSVECSSEISFIDHINGAAHRKRCGEQGLVGLLPNADGVIPPLGPELSTAYDEYLRSGEPQQVSCQSGAQAERVSMSIVHRAQNFKSDPAATELQFEPTLTKEERALVHKTAKRLKLGSKSRGHEGASRGSKGGGGGGGGDQREPWVPPLRQVREPPWAMGRGGPPVRLRLHPVRSRLQPCESEAAAYSAPR